MSKEIMVVFGAPEADLDEVRDLVARTLGIDLAAHGGDFSGDHYWWIDRAQDHVDDQAQELDDDDDDERLPPAEVSVVANLPIPGETDDEGHPVLPRPDRPDIGVLVITQALGGERLALLDGLGALCRLPTRIRYRMR